LRAEGYLDEGRVKSVEFERIGIGLGFTTLIARATVTYAGRSVNAPRTLVVKLPSDVPETDAATRRFGVGEREVRFFKELAPDIGVPVPECYYADSDNGDFVLLLEDLSNARPGDETNVALEDVELVVKNMARLHARWWESDRLAHLDWIFSSEDPERATKSGQTYRASWAKIGNGIGSEFPAGVSEMAGRLGTHFEEVMRPLGEAPVTLIHGDCRFYNLFFRDNGQRTEVVTIDWQTPSISRGAAELAYFLIFCLSVEKRRKHEKSLLRLYLNGLKAEGVDDYSYERLVEDYRRGMFRFLVIGVNMLANVDFDNEAGRAVIDVALPRLAGLTDLDCGALIPD